MATIVNTNLAGFTVTYNGVQFGGADAPGIVVGNNVFRSTPPMYGWESTPRYDESRRAVMGLDITLTVRTIVYESSVAAMSDNMAALRRKLSEPGKALAIVGLGSGFGNIVSPAGNYLDLDNGPKPGKLSAVPLGQLAWELGWTISFFISECASASTDLLAFLAFNFTSTWVNDFEGLCTRTIQGHVVIPQVRNAASPKAVLHVAEETRGNIVVSVPPGFRRVQNLWNETIDKSRLNFSIVDEQLEGDVLPPGIVEADGSFGFSTGDDSGGMSNGIATMTMSLKTAPNQPRNLAGQLFLAAALSKQGEITAGIAAAKAADPSLPDGSVIPIRLAIVNGKFDRARHTEATISWKVTQSLNSLLLATGIWTPIAPNNETQWKASMAALWGNRGFSGIGSSAAEAVIIDVCDNRTAATIGVVGSNPNNPANASLPSLTCPDIPANGGWLHYDLDIRVHREEHQTEHRRAAAYLPIIGQIFGTDPLLSNDIDLPVPDVQQSASDEHLTEYHGFPTTLVALNFVGLRFKNKPFMPQVKTIGGHPAIPITSPTGSPKIVFDAFGCPIWLLKSQVIYRVSGVVTKIKATGSLTSAAAPDVPIDL
jgi:hypothetical protein